MHSKGLFDVKNYNNLYNFFKCIVVWFFTKYLNVKLLQCAGVYWRSWKIFKGGKSRKTGWISTDRRNEASLQRTIPASIKSSTKDLSQDKSWDEKWYTTRVIYTQWLIKTDSIRISRVSSLEAFSCYPTSGSVAALFPRTTAFTGYSPQRFLSYWVAVLSECKRNSRIKLTCLATV